MSLMRAFLVAAVLWGAAAAPAAAQTIILNCDFGSEGFERRGDAVTAENMPMSSLTMRVDGAARTFSIGGTQGVVTLEPGRIVAMADQEPMHGLWLIDRRTGELSGGAYAGEPGVSVFLMARGQCRTTDGATSF